MCACCGCFVCCLGRPGVVESTVVTHQGGITGKRRFILQCTVHHLHSGSLGVTHEGCLFISGHQPTNAHSHPQSIWRPPSLCRDLFFGRRPVCHDCTQKSFVPQESNLQPSQCETSAQHHYGRWFQVDPRSSTLSITPLHFTSQRSSGQNHHSVKYE